MKAAPAIIAALALAGCVAPGSEWAPEAPPIGQPVTLSAAQVASMQTVLSYDLKDPGSIQLRNVGAAKSASGIVYACGEMNARNSFGGYVGFRPFYGLFKAGSETFNTMMLPGSRATESDVRAACRRAGIGR